MERTANALNLKRVPRVRIPPSPHPMKIATLVAAVFVGRTGFEGRTERSEGGGVAEILRSKIIRDRIPPSPLQHIEKGA